MIPEAAVEAAARSLHVAEHGPWTSGWAINPGGTPWGTSREAARHDTYLDRARAALEAAAPHMAAQALREAADAWRGYLPAVAGYGKVQPVPVWLERRAEWAGREPKPS